MANEVPLSLRQSVEQSKCEYRRLGKSGLTVSVPIFGCMSFGDPRTLNWCPPLRPLPPRSPH